jgi:hypothetical protein
VVKSRETKAPVFAKSEARDSPFAGKLLNGLDVDLEVFSRFFSGQKWFEFEIY